MDGRRIEDLVLDHKLDAVDNLSGNLAREIGNILSATRLGMSMGHTREEMDQHILRFEILRLRLMSFVRPRALCLEELSISSVIIQCCVTLERTAELSCVMLDLSSMPEIPLIRGDRSQLEYLVANLVQNALNSVATEGGKVRIRSFARKRHCGFIVADNGRGMSVQTLTRAFSPFYSSREDGLGLGLFVCRRIALDHGWRIGVFTKVDKGSIFYVRIPMEEVTA